MKKVILSLLLIISYIIGAMAQNEAMYVYRNDGVINAILKTNIDSICYSQLDLDSIAHTEYVVQEIWTVDSIYRVPLELIDSVSFVTPPTEYKEGVIRIQESLLPYVVGVDSLTLILTASVPRYILPNCGNIIIMEEEHILFPSGFAGEVIGIRESGETIYIDCTLTSLDRIYETFYSICESYVVQDEDQTSKRVMYKVAGSSINGTSFVIPATTLNWSNEISKELKKSSGLAVNGGVDLSIEVQPVVTIRTFFCQSLATGTYFSCNIHGELDLNESITAYGGLTWSKDFLDNPILRIPCGTRFVEFYVRPGGFIKSDAKISLSGSLSQKFTMDAAFDWSSRGENVLNPFVRGCLKKSNAYVTGTIDGSMQIGAFLEVGFDLLDCRLSKVCVRGERGIQIGGNIVLMNSDVANASKETKLYERLKQSNIKLDYVISEGMNASFLKYDRSWPNTVNINIHTWDLVPTFSNTKFTQSGSYAATAYSSVTGDCFCPVSVGYKLFNADKTEIVDYDATTDYTDIECTLEHKFNGLNKGEKYTLYPTVTLFGFKMLASPSSESELVQRGCPVHIEKFYVAKYTNDRGAFYNEGNYYDHKFDCSITVAINEDDVCAEIEDWGYVYEDPYGKVKLISMKAFSSPYTDTRYAFYRNSSSSTAIIFGYIKYKDDNEYYYDKRKSYQLQSPQKGNCNFTELTYYRDSSKSLRGFVCELNNDELYDELIEWGCVLYNNKTRQYDDTISFHKEYLGRCGRDFNMNGHLYFKYLNDNVRTVSFPNVDVSTFRFGSFKETDDGDLDVLVDCNRNEGYNKRYDAVLSKNGTTLFSTSDEFHGYATIPAEECVVENGNAYLYFYKYTSCLYDMNNYKRRVIYIDTNGKLNIPRPSTEFHCAYIAEPDKNMDVKIQVTYNWSKANKVKNVLSNTYYTIVGKFYTYDDEISIDSVSSDFFPIQNSHITQEFSFSKPYMLYEKHYDDWWELVYNALKIEYGNSMTSHNGEFWINIPEHYADTFHERTKCNACRKLYEQLMQDN